MDELGDPPTTARWLAWATAVILTIGVIAAVALNVGRHSAADNVVTAAGTVDPPTTVTVPPVPPAQPTTAPPSTIARSTTVPKAAAAVLKAIASTAPPTTQPPPVTTTATTRPPATTTTSTTAAPTTTTSTSTTSTSTTSTTVVTKATVTIVNEHPVDVIVTINGQAFPVAVGQQVGPVDITPAITNIDLVRVRTAADPLCGTDDVEDFQAGVRYRIAVQPGAGACGDAPAPVVRVTTL